ncbi:MAG TPA: GGDEF domain-containing protein, partial [Coriobacteriia bacterium]
LSAALLVFVAALDTASGSEVSFSIFYLVPVSFAGALISRRAGFTLAILSAAVWGYLEMTTGRGYSAAWIPYWNSAVRLGFFLLVNELIERLRRAHARQRALAREDSLTGIANARVFEECTQRTIAASRRSGRPFTIAYVDLDRFKRINDEFGHSEGDKLLRVVATLITDGVRSTDAVARLGGDEFGILIPDTEAEQARITLERIAAAIDDTVGDRWAVGATVGAVTFTGPPEDADSAVRQADELMYRGKAEGRGRIMHETWPEPGIGAGGSSGRPTTAST